MTDKYKRNARFNTVYEEKKQITEKYAHPHKMKIIKDNLVQVKIGHLLDRRVRVGVQQGKCNVIITF